MRLFLDANMITYIAVFEAFMIEGSPEELEAGLVRWERLQGDALGAALVDEIAALRVLYRIDDHAHFDWICSDVGIAEIERIRDDEKRTEHHALLARLVEHRSDVADHEGSWPTHAQIEQERQRLFPNLPRRMHRDATQFAEANLLEAYYFVTADRRFSNRANKADAECAATVPSELPFVQEKLRRG